MNELSEDGSFSNAIAPSHPRRIELPYRSNVNYEVNLCLCGAEMKDAVLVALTHRQLL